MKELEDLRELYLEEIRRINKKGDLDPHDAEVAKIALEAIEKIDIICEMDCYEDDYSERMMPMRRSYRSYNRSFDDGYYDRGYSERRGRSMTTGRYISRHDTSTQERMIRKLEDMKLDAPDDETKMAIDHVIDKLERH